MADRWYYDSTILAVAGLLTVEDSMELLAAVAGARDKWCAVNMPQWRHLEMRGASHDGVYSLLSNGTIARMLHPLAGSMMNALLLHEKRGLTGMSRGGSGSTVTVPHSPRPRGMLCTWFEPANTCTLERAGVCEWAHRHGAGTRMSGPVKTRVRLSAGSDIVFKPSPTPAPLPTPEMLTSHAENMIC